MTQIWPLVDLFPTTALSDKHLRPIARQLAATNVRRRHGGTADFVGGISKLGVPCREIFPPLPGVAGG
jgi:hypothetical protein